MAGAVIAAAALIALAWLIPQHTSPPQSQLDLAPGFMPSVAMWTCLVLAVLLCWLNLPRRGAAVEAEHEEFREEASGVGRSEFTNFLLWLLLATLAVVLMRFAGFIVAGIVLLALTMWFVGLRKAWLLAPLAIVPPVALYWIVWFAFTVELP